MAHSVAEKNLKKKSKDKISLFQLYNLHLVNKDNIKDRPQTLFFSFTLMPLFFSFLSYLSKTNVAQMQILPAKLKPLPIAFSHLAMNTSHDQTKTTPIND